ncbi:uncharacterized protein LOC123880135 [Maniola jurtina]|uniref:uncharacterized protein LOC123880135 n=1 Tax=Maniola jurtina TaxID=191418 RepID=UPI001E688C84|nr:uncharacterized protein LOC123880135 [Maniola jurtina]
MDAKGTQVHAKAKQSKSRAGPCPWLCNPVPTSVPAPGKAQAVIHPRKDVFVLKVAKIGPNGDRRCKMELELVTPKRSEKPVPFRLDTREVQCEPEVDPCCCNKPKKKRK